MSNHFENYKEIESLPLLFKEIRESLKNEKYLIALMASLCIPDILGEFEYKGSNKKKYAKWFDANVKNEFGQTYDSLDKDMRWSQISGSVVYELRCGFLHNANNGELQPDNILIDEFVLVCNQERRVCGNTSGYKYDYENLIIDPNGKVTPNSQFCYISVFGLCMEIVEAAERYLNKKREEKSFPKIKITKYGGKVPVDLFLK